MGTYDSVVQYSGDLTNSDDSGTNAARGDRQKRARRSESGSDAAQSRRRCESNDSQTIGSKVRVPVGQECTFTFGRSCENRQERRVERDDQRVGCRAEGGKKQRRAAQLGASSPPGMSSRNNKFHGGKGSSGRGRREEGHGLKRGTDEMSVDWHYVADRNPAPYEDDGGRRKRARKLHRGNDLLSKGSYSAKSAKWLNFVSDGKLELGRLGGGVVPVGIDVGFPPADGCGCGGHGDGGSWGSPTAPRDRCDGGRESENDRPGGGSGSSGSAFGSC